MNVNVMKRPNSLAWKTNPGVVLSVYPRNGYVMVIPTVWMVPMKMSPYTAVPLNSPVAKICTLAAMVDALIR